MGSAPSLCCAHCLHVFDSFTSAYRGSIVLLIYFEVNVGLGLEDSCGGRKTESSALSDFGPTCTPARSSWLHTTTVEPPPIANTILVVAQKTLRPRLCCREIYKWKKCVTTTGDREEKSEFMYQTLPRNFPQAHCLLFFTHHSCITNGKR